MLLPLRARETAQHIWPRRPYRCLGLYRSWAAINETATPRVALIEWCVQLGMSGDDPATVPDLD